MTCIFFSVCSSVWLLKSCTQRFLFSDIEYDNFFILLVPWKGSNMINEGEWDFIDGN